MEAYSTTVELAFSQVSKRAKLVLVNPRSNDGGKH